MCKPRPAQGRRSDDFVSHCPLPLCIGCHLSSFRAAHLRRWSALRILLFSCPSTFFGDRIAAPRPERMRGQDSQVASFCSWCLQSVDPRVSLPRRSGLLFVASMASPSVGSFSLVLLPRKSRIAVVFRVARGVPFFGSRFYLVGLRNGRPCARIFMQTQGAPAVGEPFPRLLSFLPSFSLGLHHLNFRSKCSDFVWTLLVTSKGDSSPWACVFAFPGSFSILAQTMHSAGFALQICGQGPFVFPIGDPWLSGEVGEPDHRFAVELHVVRPRMEVLLAGVFGGYDALLGGAPASVPEVLDR